MLTCESQIIPYVYVQFWLIALQMLSLHPALSNPPAPPNPCVGTSFLLILTNAIMSCWYSSWVSTALITSSPPLAALLGFPHLCCIQCKPLLLAFKACHPSVGVRHSPMPGFASAAHFTFLSRMLLSWPEPGFNKPYEQMKFRRRHYSSALTSGAGGVLAHPSGAASQEDKRESFWGPWSKRAP